MTASSNSDLFTFEYNYDELINNLANGGIKILDLQLYFNIPIVKLNYGIESFYYHPLDNTGRVIFTINDRKKFFLKMIKYGIV